MIYSQFFQHDSGTRLHYQVFQPDSTPPPTSLTSEHPELVQRALLTVLLIHGFPLDRTIWEPQAQVLGNQYRVITPDLRGFGQSQATPPPYSMDTYVDDLRALLDHLGVHRAVVGGLSMGGYVTFSFYRKHPDRVLGLILVDTKAGPDTPEGKQGRDDMADLARREGAQAVADRMLPKLYAPATYEHNPALIERTRHMMEAASVDGIVGALKAMRDRPDSTPLLSQIRVPSLVIVGQEDALTPVSEAQKMAEHMPGAHLEVIPGAGHLSSLEQPEAVTRTLRTFLSRLTVEP